MPEAGIEQGKLMKGKPTVAGFFSYVHADDEFEKGRISKLRERLERAIRFFSGLGEFRIFQDWQDIDWGQQWERVIAQSIENSIVLFPIITPSYFSSAACCKEILAFDQRQGRLGRDDLILPIYYLDSEPMDASDGDVVGSEEGRVAGLVKRAQFADWRALRRTEETDLAYAEEIERLAKRAIPTLKRGITATAAESVNSARDAATASPPPRETEESTPTDTDRAVAGEVTGLAAAPGYVATVTVDPMPGRGEFTTISEAIARAAPGARVHIRPGHYREQLVVNKPLELVGDGPREDIVVEAEEGSALVFDTNIGLVRGLTLRQSGSKDFSGVSIKQGRLTLEDCDLSGANLACLAISNRADPRIRRNLIHNSKQSGVHIFGQGRGTYEDNEIFSNGFSGFATGEEADPVVRRNRIHENQQSGIYTYESSRGTYEDNDVFGNGTTGFGAKKAADPIVRRNRIHENQQSGIYVRENGRGTYEDNEVFGNKYSGISVKDETDPIIRRNRIHENQQSGIFVRENGRGTYEDNDVFSNARAGVYVHSGGAPVIRRNRINKNGYAAVWVGEGGTGLYEDNDLRENTRGPWDVHVSASPELKRIRNIDK
jgi:parallel beta-helix repeat protein